MSESARGIHVSPGIYTKVTDITYATKSLGITTLGVVGETLKGPAFQPMEINNWDQYKRVFGGTSPEKFKESQYPKYELPYIAKSYLNESKQLQVCRVLGLGGYNAGPAWVITASKISVSSDTANTAVTTEYVSPDSDKVILAVLRSRGKYSKYHRYKAQTGTTTIGECLCPNSVYDALIYDVGEMAFSGCGYQKTYNESALQITNYVPIESNGNECIGYSLNGTDVDVVSGSTSSLRISGINRGSFKIFGWTGDQTSGLTAAENSGSTDYFEYSVSLNPGDKDYILKVLGTTNSDGDAPIYCESLYDVALTQALEEGTLDLINPKLEFYNVFFKKDFCGLNDIYSIMSMQESQLSRKDVGKRFLADKKAVENGILCHEYNYQTGKPTFCESCNDGQKSGTTVSVGSIYTVAQYTDTGGTRNYYYRFYNKNTVNEAEGLSDDEKLSLIDTLIDSSIYANESQVIGNINDAKAMLVKNEEDDLYYRLAGTGDKMDITYVSCDLNDYRSAYRYSSTPWIVSEIKGDYKKIEVNKLFRFHTISDGKKSLEEVKISIQNIKPDDGTFDVVIRDYNDGDESPVVLEKYTKCTMVPGDNKYIGYKIGTFDGEYESKSEYVTVEIIDSTSTRNSIPAGFLGYPMGNFEGTPVFGSGKTNVVVPKLKYNLDYDEDIRRKKQYFGLSTLIGVDLDSLTYKGEAAYIDLPEFLSHGFHLDSRINESSYIDSASAPSFTVDGESGYTFDTVSVNSRTLTLDQSPIISTEQDMEGSIYEYVDLRKFTVYFYGGFDGWDEYRNYRSNTDDFKITRYKGAINTNGGEGYSFKRIKDATSLGLKEGGITSDYYAYLSGCRQFANPEAVDINVFATPGIDYVNNNLLCDEVVEMIEEERADSIYVVTTPDKPFGSTDYEDDMYTPDDAVGNLDDSELNSIYSCTYYPWIKYLDDDNNKYIYLPPTKDVVRNMAKTDNVSFPWFAPAGKNRGNVDCVKAHYKTTLSDEDTLYGDRINPIKTFAADGPYVWGQRNLYVSDDSPLNRINVARLVLRLRKLIAISCIGMIFEPNDNSTKSKFTSTVTPILDNIKTNRGLYDYKLVVGDVTESTDGRELPVKIMLKPTSTLEYISINFMVTSQGVDFSTL